MMRDKSVWVRADDGDWKKIKPVITTSLESGVDYLLVEEKNAVKVRELGSIKIAAFFESGQSDADVYVIKSENEAEIQSALQRIKASGKKTALHVEITSKQKEQFAGKIGRKLDFLIISAPDWKVIPLENLIAELHDKDVKIIAYISNIEEAKLMLETLEHGADGILFVPEKLDDIKKAVRAIEDHISPRMSLMAAKVTKIKAVGMGDRVCVDTCSLLSRGEGMLIGSQSSGLFLVHGEVEESPYVAARPFRVNAGAVHAYVKVGEKTKYLSELEAGDEVLAVSHKGDSRKVVVGRTKIEKRPLILVEAEVENERYKTILQNAETIKLVGKNGEPISITALKAGDEVMISHTEKEKGRHFGIELEETVIER